jgi:hypothetical protein
MGVGRRGPTRGALRSFMDGMFGLARSGSFLLACFSAALDARRLIVWPGVNSHDVPGGGFASSPLKSSAGSSPWYVSVDVDDEVHRVGEPPSLSYTRLLRGGISAATSCSVRCMVQLARARQLSPYFTSRARPSAVRIFVLHVDSVVRSGNVGLLGMWRGWVTLGIPVLARYASPNLGRSCGFFIL